MVGILEWCFLVIKVFSAAASVGTLVQTNHRAW